LGDTLVPASLLSYTAQDTMWGGLRGHRANLSVATRRGARSSKGGRTPSAQGVVAYPALEDESVGIGNTNLPRLRSMVFRGDQRGFTLPEVVTVIAIMGILIAIAVIIWLGLLERRRVDAAANQLAADLRLANTNATNQLTDWRVVLVPEQAGDDGSPDYYLVKLAQSYDSKVPGSSPIADPDTPPTPRFFPANVKVRDHNSDLKDNPAYPAGLISSAPPQTRTLEFNADGTMAFKSGPNGSVCVTIDGNPQRRVTSVSATSRVKIKEAYNESPCS
jgi:prepilin-type N-terminal cleavage/methylation domain-containing protein